MIGHLSGKLIEKQPSRIIIEAGGVGYEVFVPLSTFYTLGEIGSHVELKIYTSVREDAIQLFGFSTARDRELYLKLISVQGIGARSGISLLSGMSSDEIISAITSGDIARLTTIPGVGKKTAERMIVELRDKLSSFAVVPIDGQPITSDKSSAYDDALSALLNLGYQKQAAERALKQAAASTTDSDLSAILRDALRLLSKG
jgi:Holliday junction DNA helicase RuvA